MLLAINANNTNTKFAVFDGDRLAGDWRIHTDAARTADEYVVWLDRLAERQGLALADIDAAIIATVVPQALFHLRLLCRQYLHCEPLVVGEPGTELGIGVRVDRPHEVGADRLANAVGGHLAYPGPVIVVDFGTATTFDVIDAEGNFLGGVIAAGINLSLEALHMATAKLPRLTIDPPTSVIGKNTLAAMQSGIFWGYVGLVEGLVARIRAEFGEPMTVVSTGGLAPLFVGATTAIHHLDPEVTMRGLVAIHRRNRGA
jgi:type III pantothenate kinase